MSELSEHLLDFTAIEEMDPSIEDGFHIIYEREVPFEIRHQTGNDDYPPGTVEPLKVKMLLQGPEDAPSTVRIELSSESDLFFHYVHVLDETGYKQVQETQKLMVDFAYYPNILIRMLNACIREENIFLAIYTLQGNQNARLDLIQNMEYKYVELMVCSFTRSPEDVIQRQITYRYNSMKQKMAILQQRLYDINNLVKTKNPSLLLQLQKSVGGNNTTTTLQENSTSRRR